MTDAQLKTQCKQEYNALRDQVLQLLISFEWIEGEAEGAGRQGLRRRGQEAVRQAEEGRRSRRTRTSRSSSRTPARRRSDILKRVRLDTLSNKIREKVTKGKDKVTDAQIAAVLQQEQGALRAARAARPADRPDQDEGQGRAGQEGARERPVVQVGRQEVLDRPGLQGAGRQAAGRRQGPAGEGARHGDLRRQEGRAGRPGQDPVRLLRLRGHQDHAGLPADAGAGQGDDQADARVAEPAEGARQVRQVLPQAVEGEDGLPRGLPHAGLQERAEGDADADGRPRRRRSRSSPPRRRRRRTERPQGLRSGG